MTFKNKINKIIEALKDLKALDISLINIADKNHETLAIIIASATSSLQAKSIADNLKIVAKKYKLNYLSTEGENVAEWILIDLADVVIHIMLSKQREFYDLEGLWHQEEAQKL